MLHVQELQGWPVLTLASCQHELLTSAEGPARVAALALQEVRAWQTDSKVPV